MFLYWMVLVPMCAGHYIVTLMAEAVPEKMFYNTGIGTFIWIVTNRKESRRKGIIQLIDATGLKSPIL